MSKDQPQVPDQNPVLAPPHILLRARSEATRLEKLPRWEVALVGASQDAPLLTRRLDRTEQYYYLVSYRRRDGVSARLRINAHTGELAEAVAIDKSGDALEPYLTAEGVRERVARKLARKKIAPPVVIEPFPGWKPCAQSFSAFQPFYLVWIDQRLEYYRVDGKVFNALTTGAGL